MGKVIFFPESLLEEDWVRQGASIIIKIILGMLITANAKQNYRIKAYTKVILSQRLNIRDTTSANLNQWMYLSV